jgi:2-iminoacetate synthase
MKGLSPEEAAVLSSVRDPGLSSELFETARRVKETIYGKRLVIFAPLYISNLCGNECLYCAFRASNPKIVRRALTQEEIARESRDTGGPGAQEDSAGCRRVVPPEGFEYVLKSIATVYGVRSGRGNIRRINVNIAPLSSEEFSRLKTTGIGTYQIFQETYHPGTYGRVHVGGRNGTTAGG